MLLSYPKSIIQKVISNSCQAENESQDQKTEIKSLPVVKDDREPVGAEALGRECHQKAKQDISRNPPGLMQVVDSEDKAVGNPIPFPKNAVHPGQQNAAEQEFLAQKVIEQR